MNEVAVNIVNTFDELKNPGDLFYTIDKEDKIVGFIEMCPCGCATIGAVTFDTGSLEQKSPKWKWNGNKEKPTVTPSIRRIGGCGWHGYLTNGVFKSC